MNQHPAPLHAAASSHQKKQVSPKVVVLVIAATVLGGIGFATCLRAKARAQDAKCTAAAEELRATLNNGDEAKARSGVAGVKAICMSLTPPALVAVEVELAKRQADATQTAQVARREQDAVAA